MATFVAFLPIGLLIVLIKSGKFEFKWFLPSKIGKCQIEGLRVVRYDD